MNRESSDFDAEKRACAVALCDRLRKPSLPMIAGSLFPTEIEKSPKWCSIPEKRRFSSVFCGIELSQPNFHSIRMVG